LELPLPELAAGEAVALQALARKVSDLTATGFVRTDPATLLRFLRARKGNLASTEAYFRQAAAYRHDELRLHELDTCWNLDAYERCLAPWWTRGGILGHGLRGQVIGFERFGQCRFPELLETLPFEVLKRLDAVHMQRTLAAFEEDAMRRQVPCGNAILVLDLDGLGFEYCKPKVARAYAELVSYRDMLMPCMIGQIFVIRAPRAFAMAWNMFQHLLDPVTRAKVQIVSSNAESLAVLRRYISNDVLPAYLGGARCIESDPECRQILGGGPGSVPPKATKRLLQLAAQGGVERRSEAEFSPPSTCPELGTRAQQTCCSDCVCPRRANHRD